MLDYYFIIAGSICTVLIGIVFYFTKDDCEDFIVGSLLSVAFSSVWFVILPGVVTILSFYGVFKLLNLIFNTKKQ